MERNNVLVYTLILIATIAGLSSSRGINMVFTNSKGRQINLGEIRLKESQAGSSQNDAGFSCQTIKQNGVDHGDGLYWINAGGEEAFQAYCDMTSFGGGWTMCYTTNDKANPKEETTYKPNVPYPTNGYRTNCNNIMFNEIFFVNEETTEKAYFKRQTAGDIKAIDHYGAKADTFGLWESKSLASTSIKYQLLICDTSFYKGFMVSGYTSSCYKQCDSWCGDTTSPYFRTSTSSSSYPGCAFNVNGHKPNKPPATLVSVGLR